MLLSFIISAQGREDKLFKTITSLRKQTNPDFEIIIVNDDPNIEKESIEFIKDQYKENEKVIVAFNNKGQGSSTNWNTAIELASGDYFAIVKEGDILDFNFVEEIKNMTANKKPKLDIIEHQSQFSGIYEVQTGTVMKLDHTYSLPTDKEVYAYVNQSVYGKVFRTKYIKDFRINFRRSVRFDTLFVYKALGHARTFHVSSKVLVSHRTNVLKYSAFDLVNQWPHILNYYRRIGAYKELKDELNYAYYYQLNFDFLNLVKEFDNKQLYKKALKYAETKTQNKLKGFIKSNEVFVEGRDEAFVKRINTFENFTASELRKLGK
ncbi:glycosyltransferase family 2 protein [[Acholeplasma] multilocale]|uniref:glycosyltransferase family 2 protein n=1 Tax=[Acholeplasma] multilocale TaxID=264638 RepID=UPI00047B95BA|nr:glycosyltransferase family 2 protein [[Acholeplasma] multilocale]